MPVVGILLAAFYGWLVFDWLLFPLVSGEVDHLPLWSYILGYIGAIGSIVLVVFLLIQALRRLHRNSRVRARLRGYMA